MSGVREGNGYRKSPYFLISFARHRSVHLVRRRELRKGKAARRAHIVQQQVKISWLPCPPLKRQTFSVPESKSVDVQAVPWRKFRDCGKHLQGRTLSLHLLLNATQAMGGRGSVQIDSRAVEGWHELRIIDHGPGISDKVREHLFEPFFTTKSRGTGLGLATARRILELHGGSIELQTPPTGGVTAVVRIPNA